eukprot:TRINITY_DN7921_c0_g1_i2.p2 TRINITY_DN7921_c0_g1~~TRINITY_DN7921_c0_g1_i2.p2  ORF type:complete len:171 (+),score=25.40 TRINITY_DN7921_c0_g1_i2:65-577(+)
MCIRDSMGSEQKLVDICVVNIIPYVLLTKKLLTQLKRRDHKSALVYVASELADIKLPFAETYIATKIFNVGFSEILKKTTDSEKLDIMCYKPSLTDTNFHSGRKVDGPMILPPDKAVEGFLNHMGQVQMSYGHRRHYIYAKIACLLPAWFRDMMARKIFLKESKKSKKNE